MNRWRDLIKLPLYRVFMPIAVGVIFVFLAVIGKISVFLDIVSIKIFLECFKQSKIQVMEIGEDIKIVLPNFVLIVAILAIFFVIGEVCSMMGEIIVNLFFCYWPIAPFKVENGASGNSNLGSSNSGRNSSDRNGSRNVGNGDDYLMEKVFPCSEKWIKYQDFVRVSGREAVAEVSEVHFVLSRFFAGLMIVSLATVNIIVPIIILIFVFFFVAILTQKCCIICRYFLIISYLIITYITCGLVYDSFVSFLFATFFFISSLYYRAHANLLIYHQRSGDNI